ncbi:hypothetical protein L2W58_09180 [Dethiosulfovibrio sp. F2B]|uniref:hypothetical protein n=1 Tax=Dethiosulfovibrio faecalis TaxID=2720018 RepID=UPI001F46A07F|nr:hypothetical protein [Dethiosulfovibrio faecalis]MCF4151969.1 hypothetical protein [Dethiosulfovibrio faecalis]MEA3284833.1 hypothetical protein [Synergistota bacterium]
MADGIENWRSEDYFDGGDDPFRFLRDDDTSGRSGTTRDEKREKGIPSSRRD